jgi:hypothetical protein
LLKLQRAVGGAIMRSLTPRWRMDKRSKPVADAFIKPNDRLTSFERLEIYNRQYWFRLIDCFYDDYPGLRAVLGERRFARLAKDYLARYPSTSFTLRNLGQYLTRFLRRPPMAVDMARLEWARIVAFDGEEKPVVTTDDLLDAKPDRLRLVLQPYLTLLRLRYPLDDFLIALKQEGLRAEASHAVSDLSHRRIRRLRRPRPETVYVAVHRMDNAVYYKRLTREQFDILRALQSGKTLAQACARVRADAGQLRDWFAAWASFGWFCRR